MDQHRTQTGGKAATANGGSADALAAGSESKRGQPSGVIKDDAQVKNVGVELVDHATSAAAAALTSMAENLGGQAQDIAGRAGDRAAATTRAAGDYLSRSAKANPLTSLLVAGVVGYALAFLVYRR